MATSLTHLEGRLKDLEESVLSSENDEVQLIDSLSSMNQALNNLASRRERVNLVFKRVPEIQEYLKPGFVEKEGVDVSAQRDYLLLIEDEIHQIASQLQRVDKLSSVLNSEQIRDFRKHVPKMNQLNMKQLDQLEQTNDLSSEVTELLNQYNKMTQQLSEHFVQMDQVITNLEIKKIQENEDT